MSHTVHCPSSLIDEVFLDLLSHVINTMMNLLLQYASIVKCIETNKRVDPDVALRDKLKVYARSLALNINNVDIQLLLFSLMLMDKQQRIPVVVTFEFSSYTTFD